MLVEVIFFAMAFSFGGLLSHSNAAADRCLEAW